MIITFDVLIAGFHFECRLWVWSPQFNNQVEGYPLHRYTGITWLVQSGGAQFVTLLIAFWWPEKRFDFDWGAEIDGELILEALLDQIGPFTWPFIGLLLLGLFFVSWIVEEIGQDILTLGNWLLLLSD